MEFSAIETIYLEMDWLEITSLEIIILETDCLEITSLEMRTLESVASKQVVSVGPVITG